MKPIRLASALLIVIAAVVALYLYASQAAISAQDWPHADIVHYSSLANDRPPKQPVHLKVITYNIGYASGDKNNRAFALTAEEVRDNLDNMILELRQHDADVIALQEVDFNAQRTHNINQLEYLARGLNLPYAAYVVTWNKRYVAWPHWPPNAHFGRMVSGQAVLSRYPILDQQTFKFDKPAENPFWYNAFYLDRIAQRLTLEISDQVAVVWNVHLEAFKKQTRLKQINELATYMNGDSHFFLLVAGDFNSVNQFRRDVSPEQRKELLEKGEGIRTFLGLTGLRHAILDLNVLSFPSWDPIKKIDHILYKGLSLQESGHIDQLMASDHLPVWAEFELE